MKKLRFIFGVLLLALALILAFVALIFPHNGLFTALWNAGIFTFRGEGSLLMIYLVSGLSFIIGASLLVRHAKSKEGA